jgi:hypothetical protein
MMSPRRSGADGPLAPPVGASVAEAATPTDDYWAQQYAEVWSPGLIIARVFTLYHHQSV